VANEEATDASASEPAVVELAGAAEAAVQTFHAAATVEEATVASASEPTVVESVSALDASVHATAEAVATGNEATDACASEPAVVESVGAAPAATLVDPFVSPPAAPLTIPQSAQEQVVAGPHADQAGDSTSEQEGGAILSLMEAPSGFVRRLKSIAWPLFLVAAVVLCGILALQAPATEQARQAQSFWSLFGAPRQQLPETAYCWSRPKPDAATHSLLADLYSRSVVASWPVCDKSASPLSVAGKNPFQPPAKFSVVLRVELEILRHGRRVWIGKVAPETTFYGTLFLLTQVVRLVGI
jgi:hypothetical protein